MFAAHFCYMIRSECMWSMWNRKTCGAQCALRMASHSISRFFFAGEFSSHKIIYANCDGLWSLQALIEIRTNGSTWTEVDFVSFFIAFALQRMFKMHAKLRFATKNDSSILGTFTKRLVEFVINLNSIICMRWEFSFEFSSFFIWQIICERPFSFCQWNILTAKKRP